MCHNCGCPSYVPCSCTATGCPILLDSACVIYHKDLNVTSGLIGLNLGNGSTLQLILDSIDVKLRNLTVADWDLSCLRVDYVINSIQQFAEAMDTELCLLKARVAALEP
jgi:hypothetical protein